MSNNQNVSVRIDKYLWAVRIFKTRSIAADECKKGRVIVKGIAVKPSKNIEKGEIFEVKQPPIIRKFKIIELLSKRVGAKLVENYLEELTPETEFEKLKTHNEMKSMHTFEQSRGKPNKKQRRDMDRFFE